MTLKYTLNQVSIIMPVKNAMPFLRECIASVVGQSYSHWELIAVDDHSSDASLQFLKKRAGKSSKIKVLTSGGHGIIPALQMGYKFATGSLITRMDADDIMHPDKLSLMVSEWDKSGPGSLIVGLVKYFSEKELGHGYQDYVRWLNDLTSNAKNYDDIFRECPIPSPCWLIHRGDFESCGGFESQLYPEDYDLAFRFREANLTLKPVCKTIHYWRDHPDRTSRNNPIYLDNLFAALKMHHFLHQDRRHEIPLILWGAGRKGKKIAKELIQKKTSFIWISNNTKKTGLSIYNVLIEPLQTLDQSPPSQVLVAISTRHSTDAVEGIIAENIKHKFYRFT